VAQWTWSRKLVGHGQDEPGIITQQANQQRFENHPQTLPLRRIVGQIRPAAHSSFRFIASSSYAYQVFDEMPQHSLWRRHATPLPGPYRRWLGFTRPEQFLEAETGALGLGARCTGAAARGAADLRPSRGSTLGCVVYQHAGARFPPDAHTEQRPGNQRRGPRRRGGVNNTCTQTKHADQFAGETHGDGEHKDMEGPSATSRSERPQAHKAIPRPSPEHAMVCGHSRACARAALPCPLGASLW
jgi:hypothetical protein